jgi:hypothetical protein
VRPRWQPSLDDYIDMAAYLLGGDRAAIRELPMRPSPRSAASRLIRRWSSSRLCCSSTLPTTTLCRMATSARVAADRAIPRRERPAMGPPDVETDAGLVERVAAADATHEDVIDWICRRTAVAGGESIHDTA